MIAWTIEHVQKKDRRREVTVNVEGKMTSRDCAGLFTLCLDNHNRCDHLVFDLTQVEEKDGSIPVLICCLRKTAGFAAGHISLRGIPNQPPGPTADFPGNSLDETCEFYNDCHNSVSRFAYGAPLVGELLERRNDT